ncbi:putative pentatricopeptide repeat-containing protein At3g15930 isoform X2 [Lycium barbarum]|uniref:putative pentatricopeptide repeat-containing protein At3g15930 isoform X2 n=1 Tax=Lycium barbarum TaxID=112863 RepID=UPI00293F4CDB|nr:putative pentatricopeptide repeat-containing protein At3g15930 isoform X2 [Lycium barbarum]XP_060205177.1 putative pentatricopeptide repeat-containing protein At3g15930 isoform X2 [Lycium barbarum]
MVISSSLRGLSNLTYTSNFAFHKKGVFFIASLCPNKVFQIAHLHLSPEIHLPLHSLIERSKSMDQIKQIHSVIIQKGLTFDPMLCSKIIAFCSTNELGDMKYARYVFDIMHEPGVFVWNTMIKGYSRESSPQNAVSIYREMLNNNVQPDNYTFPFLLKGFTREEVSLKLGKSLHAHICKFGFELNEFVQHALIHMYRWCGLVDMARGVFNLSAKSDILIWNAMISGYNRSKRFGESRELFYEMEEKQLQPTSVTLVSVISALSQLKDLETGNRVHQYVKEFKVQSNLVLDNALIDLYAGSGKMDVALGLFQSMKHKDVISWTTIVKGFVSIGQVDVARKYFNQMPERDSISWTAMIDGYVKENRFKDVLMLFREMQAAKKRPDEFTMVSILTTCAHLGALELGEWIKAYIDKHKIKVDIHLGNAVIDMYFKCGNVEKALMMFSQMPCRDKFTWTAMIIGLATNGHEREALDMFFEMLRASETPDDVTYIGVLSACTHMGMVDGGKRFFASMTSEHGIRPNVIHYGCMVDLLGRSGRLEEAYEVVKNMPMKPNSIVWGALLGACRIHKDVQMAEIAAQQLLQLEPGNGAVYVLLCNIYAACKKWENLRETRRIMTDHGIKKTPGCSLIEMHGIVHEFVAGDQSHPLSESIYSKLAELIEELKFAGYIPDTSEVALDIGEEEKENSLNRHN